MAENLKKVLYNNGGLEITFFVEDGIARVDFRSNGEFDLSESGDVVLFVNGDNIAIESDDPTRATGRIGEWSAYEERLVRLMTRVGEFFDGWEFEP